MVVGLLGCWQAPFTWSHFDYLLTLLMYPIAFHVCSRVSYQMLQQWIVYCGIAAGVGILYALVQYSQTSAQWQQAYGLGKSLPTFMDTDHVRFGLFLSGTAMLVLLLTKFSIRTRILICILLVSSITFMAVRTAWVTTILIAICFLAFLSLSKRKPKQLLKLGLLFITLLAMAIAAYQLFPTVQQKWAYTRYDWQQYTGDSSNMRYSDGARRIINTLAFKEITEKGAANKGWAGIAPTLQQSFQQAFPQTPVTFRWPFNQWLFWWMGSGLLGMLLFTCWMFYPLLRGIQKKQWTPVAWTLAIAASCLVESTLSLQYGVWMHAWIGAIAWQLQDLSTANNAITGSPDNF
jgi:O-antigen ligase